MLIKWKLSTYVGIEKMPNSDKILQPERTVNFKDNLMSDFTYRDTTQIKVALCISPYVRKEGDIFFLNSIFQPVPIQFAIIY
jgi:hypothetical protein